eukprot:GFYU01012506.1.p1 GENE.GFYU01012506.1~~GFYU01012506.1.p1  ORF type:complete len:182 (+),score=38.00 GFYU01012506.1:116-661(+)
MVDATVVKAMGLSAGTVAVFVALGAGIAMFVGPPTTTTSFQYKGAALVTAVYMTYLYLAVFFQSMVGICVWGEMKKKVDSKISLWAVKYGPASYEDKRVVAGNRVLGNAMEQTIPFLSGMWLVAVVVSDSHAAACGWVYLAIRAVYPLFYVTNPNLVVLSTCPNYIIVCYMWTLVVKACLA